jgi:hypothetical protein
MNDCYREIARRHEAATGKPLARLAEIVDWALARHELSTDPEDIREMHIRRLGDALRSEVAQDRRGRRYRQWHCLTAEQEEGERPQTLWGQVDEAPHEFLAEALWQRHGQVGADVGALAADLDHVNERRRRDGLAPIQMSFDFTRPGPADAAG